jgi:hypothetical protein
MGLVKITWLGRWPAEQIRKLEPQLKEEFKAAPGVAYITLEWVGDNKAKIVEAKLIKEG